MIELIIKDIYVFLIIFLFIGNASATVININSSGDTHVTNASDVPQGSTVNMYVGNGGCILSNKDCFGLVNFSGISSIPNSSVINSATLYMYELSGGNLGHVQSIYNITSLWNESTAKWTLQPTYTSTPFAYADGLDGVGWMNWNVRNTVNSWVRNSMDNYGFFLKETSGITSSYLGYATKEYGNYIPYLTVDYTLNSAPTAPSLTSHANYNASISTQVFFQSTDANGDTITYHYNIGTTSGGTDVANGVTTTFTNSTNFTLTPNNTYYFKAKACDVWACSNWSAESSFIYTTKESVTTTIDSSKLGLNRYVRNSSEGLSYVCGGGCFFGYTTAIERALIKYNVSQYPNHTISSASFTGYQTRSETQIDNIYKIESSWDASLTWANQPDVSAYESSQSVTGVGWYTFGITNMFKEWYSDPAINYGFELRTDNESSFYHYFYLDVTFLAYITVVMDNSLPYATNFSIDHVSNNPAVLNSTPTFRWTSYDLEGDNITSNNIQVWDGSGGTGTNFWNYNGSNTSSLVYAGTSLVKNTTYYVRIKLNDSLSEGLFYESTFRLNTAPSIPTSYTNFTSRTNLTPIISWTKGIDIDGNTVNTYVYVGENESNLTLEGSYSGTSTQIGINKVLSKNTNYTYRMRSYDGYEFSMNTSLSNFTTGVTPIFSNENVPSVGTINVAFNIDINIDVGASNISTKTVTLTDPNLNINTYTMTLVSNLTYRKIYTPTIAGTYLINYYNATDEAGLSNSTLSTKTIVVSVASSTSGGGGGAITTPTPTSVVTEYKPSIDITSIGESDLGIILLEILLLGGFIVFISGLLEYGKTSSLVMGFIIISVSVYGLGWLS